MRAVCTPRACLVYARLEHAEHGSPFSHFFARFARFRRPRLLLCILMYTMYTFILYEISQESIERKYNSEAGAKERRAMPRLDSPA